jgi:hypothetical protein
LFFSEGTLLFLDIEVKVALQGHKTSFGELLLEPDSEVSR